MHSIKILLLSVFVLLLSACVGHEAQIFVYQESRTDDYKPFDAYALIAEDDVLDVRVYAVKTDAIMFEEVPSANIIVLVNRSHVETLTLSCMPYKALDLDLDKATNTFSSYLVHSEALRNYCALHDRLELTVNGETQEIMNPHQNDALAYQSVTHYEADALVVRLSQYAREIFSSLLIVLVSTAFLLVYRKLYQRNMNHYTKGLRVRKLPELPKVLTFIMMTSLILIFIVFSLQEDEKLALEHGLYTYNEQERRVQYMTEFEVRETDRFIASDNGVTVYERASGHTNITFYFLVEIDGTNYIRDIQGIHYAVGTASYAGCDLQGSIEEAPNDGLYMGYVLECYNYIDGQKRYSSAMMYADYIRTNNRIYLIRPLENTIIYTSVQGPYIKFYYDD